MRKHRQHVKRWAPFAVLLLLVQLVVGVVMASPATATTGTVAWSNQLSQALQPMVAETAPDGSTTLVDNSCDDSYQAVGVASNGTVDNTVTNDPNNPQHCFFESAVGLDGTVYTITSSTAMSNPAGVKTLHATKSGTELWSTQLDTCSNGSGVYPRWLTIGADGNLYFIVDKYSCYTGESDTLDGYDAATGVQLFAPIPLNSQYPCSICTGPFGGLPPVPQTMLSAYNNGLVVLDGDQLRYFSYAGVENTTVNTTLLPPASTQPLLGSAGADGTEAVAYSGIDSTNSCYKQVQYIIYRQGDTGTPIEIDLGSCVNVSELKLLPNGDMAILDTSSSPKVRVIDQSGTDVFTPYDLSTGDAYTMVDIQPDANGNVMVFRSHFGAAPVRYHIDVLGSTGSVIDDFSSSVLTPVGQTESNDSRVLPGMVDGYALAASCPGICGTGSPVTLTKVSMPGLGMDYPRSAVFDQISTKLQYVAMGDSFSSGEGNTPFLGESDSDGCHRSADSYPVYLQKNGSLNLYLQGFVACSGATTGDVLLGRNGEASQLAALSDTTKVVTITIGGNDVGFGDFAKGCYISGCGTGSSIYASTMSAIDNTSFASNLENLYQQILTDAPNATLYVVGYPILTQSTVTSGCVDPQGSDGQGAINVVNALDSVIQSSVTYVHDYYLAPIQYIDATGDGSGFSGHQLCSYDPYFYSASLDPGAFHPKSDGQGVYETLVAASL